MKYDVMGMDGLNLDQAGVHKIRFTRYPDWMFIYPTLLKEGEKGDFSRAYEQFGLEFNNMPLYYKAPLFPAVLSASHRLFTKPEQPFTVLNTRTDFDMQRIEFNWYFMQAQFWAVIVPMFSSLLVVLMTFFFSRQFFDGRTSLYAMLFMAIHPVDVVTSYKLLTDDFVTFFVIASLFLFFLACKKKNAFIALLAGMTEGLALLSKQSAVLVFPTAVLFFLFTSEEKWFHPRAWILALKSKILWGYFLGAAFISAHWFFKVYQVYGNPFYQPDSSRMLNEDLSGWFGILSHRPHAFLLFLFNIPALCPVFLFGHMTFGYFFNALDPRKADLEKNRGLVLLWFWVLPFLLFFTFRIESREERYLLPVYPALAILSGYGFSSFQERIARYFSRPALGRTFAFLFIAGTVAWSVPIGLESVFKERFLILEPAKLARVFYQTAPKTMGWTP